MTTAAPATERKSLRELRKTDMTLFCKNNTENKITANSHEVQFELDPFEIAIMPKECLSIPGVQRLWMRKAITISDDEELENEIILHMGGIVEMSGLRPVQVMQDDGTIKMVTPELEETSGRNDITMKVDERGQPITPKCVIGGEPVYQTAVQIAEGHPPLCPIHEAESARIVSVQLQDGSWKHSLPTIER